MRGLIRSGVFLFLLLSSAQAFAEVSLVSGKFYGTEPTANLPHGRCQYDPPDAHYSDVTTFTVSQSGQYWIASTQYGIGVDVWFGIYSGNFNPGNAASGRLAQQTRAGWDVDDPVIVNLQAGTTYRIVLSPWCSHDRGVWTLAFTGPGQVNSSARVNGLDSFITGNLTNSGQTANLGCGSKPYRESGAQRVDTSGTYYVTDVSYFFGLGLCISVYSAPVNPANPSANRILQLVTDYYGEIQLNTGQNYYFVITANTGDQTGEYLYLVTPGTDFYVDPTMAGAWADLGTSAQGYFFDILGHTRQFFVGWFTFELQRPPGNVQALLGDPGHRWLTAFGDFAGNVADLDLEVSSGGVFNAASGASQDCSNARATWNLGSAGRSGVSDIQRVSEINTPACETLMQRSGTPRKLNRN